MVETEKKLEQFNEDELCPPEWMNRQFFEKILRETCDDESIQVIKFALSKSISKLQNKHTFVD